MKADKFYRNLFITLLTFAVLIILYEVRRLLTPVFSALLTAYILYPIVGLSNRIGVPKFISVSFIFFAVIGIIVSIGFVFLPAIKHEVAVFANPDDYRKETKSRLVQIGGDISLQMETLGIIESRWEDEEIISKTSEWITEQSTFIVKSVGELAKQTGEFLLIFTFVLAFSLLDSDKLYHTIIQLIPNSFFEPGIFILKKTTDILGYYLRGLVIENLILGIIALALLSIVSILSPLSFVLAAVIAVIIAITNVIRIIGPVIGGLIGILLILLTSRSFIAIIGLIGIVAFVQLLDSIIILPLVMREQVKVHPVLCFIGVLSGGILGGVLGMILAIPVIGSIKVIYRILTVEMKKFNMDPEFSIEF